MNWLEIYNASFLLRPFQFQRETFFLPLGFNPDVLYAFGAGADAVDFFSCRLPNVYAGDRILFDSLIVTSKMEVTSC